MCMSVALQNMPELAKRMKYVRRTLNLTQQAFAEMAGTSQQAIQQAEKGLSQNPRYLFNLAQELDIPYEWLAHNQMPDALQKKGQGAKKQAQGLSDRRSDEVLESFAHLSEKEQELMLNLMKERAKKDR